MPVPIVHIGAALLRQKVKTVTDFSEAQTHCQTLVEGVRELQGAGLAANQIGLDLNIFVAEVRKTELFPDREESPLTIMLNAEIIARSDEMEELYEGCFSIPGYVGVVPRHKWIEVKYQTQSGEHKREVIHGYLARVIQHETDHLNGFFYIDRMSDMKSFITRDHYIAFINEAKSQAAQKNQAADKQN